jgi:RimJ/RimL family protein N-acetyltransferase
MTPPVLIDVPASIATARLDLRAPRAGDGAMVHAAVAESLPALRVFLAAVPWVAGEQSVQASEVFCRTAQASHLARTDFPFLMFHRSTGELVGCVGLHRPVWATPRLEVGYWCRTSRAGNGYVAEGVGAMVALAFQTFKAVRLELITDEANLASRRVAERCGFALEGVLVNERRGPDGRLRNTCMYARTQGQG